VKPKMVILFSNLQVATCILSLLFWKYLCMRLQHHTKAL
jgi:hypothetical protein